MIQVAEHLTSRLGRVKEAWKLLKKFWQEVEVVIFNNPGSRRLRNPNASFLCGVSGTMYFKVSSEIKDQNRIIHVPYTWQIRAKQSNEIAVFPLFT